MRTIRASEIGAYIFCQRAWWYQRKGIDSENTAELAAGTEIHHQHGQQIAAAGCLRSLAVVMLVAAIVAVVFSFVLEVF